MFEKMRQALVALTMRHDEHETGKDVRRLQLMAAKGLRAGTLERDVGGIDDVAAVFARETGTWLRVEDVAAGRGGVFDACDLEVWLEIARGIGMPAVPARRILSLDEDDAATASGSLAPTETPLTRRIAAMAAKAGIGATETPKGDGADDAARAEAVEERLFAAMDDVPEGWMVRSSRCGPSNLKTLAGAGVAGPAVPEVRFGPDLEFGPGWVRRGNRRMVDATDRRTVQTHAQAPEGTPLTFLARPWIPAARMAFCEDPHRHDTAFRGPGLFPAEWRAFVEDGVVVGVSSYYGWTGAPTPRNARIALEVRAMAQAIADATTARGLVPRHTDVALRLAMARRRFAEMEASFAGIDDAALRADAELAWRHATWRRDVEAVEATLERFPQEGVSMTLDFLEARGGPGGHGLVLLEGGPSHHPFGGGHCCAFAGAAGQPFIGMPVDVRGVAFRVMDHVTLADMATWRTGDRTGRILDWDAVAALAASEGDPDALPDGVTVPDPRADHRTPEQLDAAFGRRGETGR